MNYHLSVLIDVTVTKSIARCIDCILSLGVIMHICLMHHQITHLFYHPDPWPTSITSLNFPSRETRKLLLQSVDGTIFINKCLFVIGQQLIPLTIANWRLRFEKDEDIHKLNLRNHFGIGLED